MLHEYISYYRIFSVRLVQLKILPTAFPSLSKLETLISFHTESKLLFIAQNTMSQLYTEKV